MSCNLEENRRILRGGAIMQAYELADILAQRAQAGERWQEFLRVPALSVGIYVLAAGSSDLQQPHTEDEVYYVVSGRAHIRVADQQQPVGTGSIVYVAKGVEHRFFDMTEELTVLVFFAPAEHSGG
jgi:mannose-6-phosphate isomerase-like protein (cupin superfamily)